MSALAEARKNLPNLNSLNDADFVDALHEMYYPTMNKADLSAKLGYVPPAPPVQQAGLIRTAGDVGIKLAQGVVDAGSAVVGLGSLATGGLVGKGMRAIGYDPKTTNEAMGQYLSDSQKASDGKVAAADGFVDTVATSLQNPRAILGSVAESAPGMLAGMGVTSAVARGIAAKAALATGEGAAASASALAAGQGAKAATSAAMATEAGKKAAGAAIEKAGTKLIGIGAATEGAQSGGQIADNAQAEGRDYADYALPSLAAGVGTAAIGLGAGKLMGDSATSIATGARSAAVKGGMAARVGKEALSEGVLEEMPQSAQEQFFTNVAMGEEDRTKGIGNAAGSGLVTGAAMGAGMGMVQRNHAAPAVPPVQLPNTGPLSQAANAGQQAAANATVPAAAPGAAQQPSLADIDARLAELVAIGHGSHAKRGTDVDGNDISMPAIAGRPLTIEEKNEFNSLKKTRADRVALPPEQQAQFDALLAQEQAERDKKFQPALEAAAANRAKAAQAAAKQKDDLELAQIEEMVQADQQAAHQAELARQQQDLDDIAARVEQERLGRSEANRAALRNEVLANNAIPAEHKKAAFAAALKRDGYHSPALNDVDHYEFDSAATPVASTPNEMIDAVPERKPVPAASSGTNTQAVDAAIAAGMRLKTVNGTILHKPGSSKIFKLSTAQKAHYLAAMERLSNAEQQADAPVDTNAPMGTVKTGENTELFPENPAVDAVNGHVVPENGASVSDVAPGVSPTAAPEAATVAPTAQPLVEQGVDDDTLLGQSREFVRTSGTASIAKLQRHLRVGYNRAGRLLETLQAEGLVSPMASNGSREVLAKASTLDASAHDAATSPLNDVAPPTEAQKEAGNYKKAHVRMQGLNISIENPVASTRSGIDKAGVPWENEMQHHYGYIKGTVGMDKDHIDTFIGPNQDSEKVFVVDQVDPETGRPDEHKVMLGFDSQDQAQAAYQANYAPGWQGGKTITETSMGEFKDWLHSGKTKAPFAEQRTLHASAPASDQPAMPLVQAPAAVNAMTSSEPAPTAPVSATEPMSVQQLNRMTVRDMNNEQLRQAQLLFAGGPRAKKIASEMNKRGFAPPIEAQPAVEQDQVTAPTGKPDTPSSSAAEKPMLQRKLVGKGDFGQNIFENSQGERSYTHKGDTYLESEQRATQEPGAPRHTSFQTIKELAVRAVPPAAAAPVAPVPAPIPSEATTAAPTESLQVEHGAGNKLFTAERAAKARALLKSKLGTTYGGIDPELLMAGIELAGFHIEAGARTFAAYAKAMIADIGDGVRPYLRSYYEGVRHYPGHDNTGMTPASDIDAQMALIAPPPAEAPPVAALGTQPKAPRKTKGGNGNAVLTQQFGVEHIDGYASSERYPTTPGDIPGGGIKQAFLDDARSYLNNVAALLKVQGFEPTADSKGKARKPVSINPAGPAVSGDVSLALFHPSIGRGIYVNISGSALRGMVPNTESGVAVMMRVTKQNDPFGGDQNRWMETDLSANDLAEMINKTVNVVAEREKSATIDTNAKIEGQQDDGQSDAGSESQAALGRVASQQNSGIEAGRRMDGGERGGSSASARPDRPIGDAGLPRPRGGRSGAETVHSVDTRATSGRRLAGNRAGREGTGVSGNDAGADHPVTPSTPAGNIPARNFTITEDVRLGQGGEVVKFNDNLAAIRTMKAIEAAGRRATPEEQATMARYVGWGGLANAFPSPESGQFKDAWRKRGPELAELLTPQEYALARRSTLDSHYTSKTIVDSMWSAAHRMGYRGGLALESSMGAGNFIGLMPEHLARKTKFIGVEYDNLTARIATLLYPQETVLNSGFQDVPLANGSFDLSIGNPPFGDQSLRFQFKPELNGHSIHNQFFLASLDAVKPGGLQIQVVSRYLLDKLDSDSRQMLARKARLLGAVRLPDTAFKENARTSVVTDVLYLQRLTPVEETHMNAVFDAADARPLKSQVDEAERQALAAQVPEWVGTTKVADPLGGDPIVVNNYFATNPDMILGTLERSGSMAFHNDVTVRLDQVDSLPGLLVRAVGRLPENAMVQEPDAIEQSIARHQDMSDALRIALEGHENGSIRLEHGELAQIIERETPEGEFELSRRTLSPASPWSEKLYQNAKGQWYTVEPVLDAAGKPQKMMVGDKATNLNVYDRKVFATEADIPATMLLGELRYGRLKQLVDLRDKLKAQLTLESEDAPVAAIEANRSALASAYQAYVKDHGLISEPVNSVLLSGMPDGALVQALEFSFKPKISAARAARIGEPARAASATPAPILSKRVIEPYVPPSSASSTADALAITLAETGRVDLARIAALLDKTVAQVEEEMAGAARPMLFLDPESNQWETRNDYLTGQVKRKLNAARAAGLSKNVAALEEIQPEAWGAENVTAMLGSSWIPPEVYGDFIRHISGNPAAVTYSAITNAYNVLANETTRANEEEWSSTGYTAAGLISDLLNSSPIRVTTKDLDGNTVIHREYTDLALLKARAITNEFNDWVYKDAKRRNQLVDLFNDKYNTRVARQHDGSHLKLVGKVPDAVIDMRRHQKNAIWRGISERFMLIDHAVGAGKTFTAIARAMERRRMGLSKKPAIVVPNHMVEQFASDVYRLYPGAKVLAAGKRDFEKSRRRKLFAKIATGDFDVVIIPHSSFGFIGVAPETEARYLQQELDLALQAVDEAQAAADEEGTSNGRKPFGVKEAERLVERITTRMEKIKGDKSKDRLLTFEQMGIDDLTVDEAHEFKNLFYSSRLTGVKGMGNKTGSQKAFDLYTKVRVLRESPTGSVVFMTGTPISNSAVEMYTMVRYLAADELREMGLENFDAWRSQFVSTDAGWEPTETGRLKEVNRLGRTWSNMRSLMDLYYSFTDSVDNDAIKAAYREDNDGAEFPIPRVKGGDRQSIVMQPTPAQIAILDQVMSGFDDLPGIADPYERNKARLRLMDRARKVSLDVRAADPSNRSKEVGGKLDVIADNITRLYQKWDSDRGTQLVFLDRSVPKARGDDVIIKEYDALLAAQAKAYENGDEAEQRRTGERLERFDADEMESLRGAQSGGWNAYQQIKDNLIARGIPAAEIAFVQDANTDAQKKALFDAVNDGVVRVLVGSTPRMGAGTNVQLRLVGIHHADVTWKPSDIEQREGRGIRQGNMLLQKYGMDHFEMEILAYATERTIDAKMWSLNASKLKTINAIRKYDGAFTMEFEDQDSVSMAELAALASGDPLLLERVKLMSEIDKLELLKRQHARKAWGITSQIEDAQSDLQNLPARIEDVTADLGRINAGLEETVAAAQRRSVVVEGVSYHDGQAARAAVYNAIKAQQQGDEKKKVSLAVAGRRLTSLEGAMDAVGAVLGDVHPFAMTVDGEQLVTRTGAARALATIASDVSAALKPKEAQSVNLGEFLGMALEATMELDKRDSYFTTLAVLRQDGTTLASGSTNWRENAAYTTSSMRTALDALEASFDPDRLSAVISKYQQRIASAEQDLPALLEKRIGGFAQQAELQAKNERLDQVIRELSGKQPAAAETDAASAGAVDNASYYRDTDSSFLREFPRLDGGPADSTKAPMTLSGREMGQSLKDVQVLNRILATHDMDGVRALRTAPNEQYALARQIGAALGIKVHYVGGTRAFHGVATGGVAYLTEGMPHPELAIAGHETLHALEQLDPELGNQLRDQVRSYLRDGVVQQRMVEERTLSVRTGEGEVLADINGAMWLDPVFWRDLAKADRNLFRRVAYGFMQAATKAITTLRGGRFDISKLVSDVDAVRAILVATWAQHAQGLPGAQVAPGAAFSRKDGPGSAAALDQQRNAGRQFAVAALQSGGRAAYDALKAAGKTNLNYHQWVVTKTPNFKNFYGDWEQHGNDKLSSRILESAGKRKDDAGTRSGHEDIASGFPAFPGQSGPVTAVGNGTDGQVGSVSGQVEPVVYYHGSRADISAFDLNHPDRKDSGWLGRGIYVTDDADIAHQYASVKSGVDKPNITPLFVAVRNPYPATMEMKKLFSRASQADIDRWTAQMIAAGYDGVVLNMPGVGQELVAFDAGAVKSAVSNSGAFDAGNNDIRFSRDQEQTNSPAFTKWFGKSKVVDQAGQPLVVYHGSGQGNIQSFQISADGHYGKGAYFTSDPAMADHYAARGERKGGNGTVYPVYLSLQRPLTLNDLLDRARWKSDVETRGVAAALSRLRLAISDARADGVIIPGAEGTGENTVYAVFSSNQIKSAIGNNGNFDRGNSDIAFSRAGIGDALQNAANNINAVRLPANYLVGDLFNKSGKISWWHKTIGTMDNLAKRKPLFARVYEAVQSFLGDVSRYAVVAADLAPTLLPQLENIRDIFGASRKQAVSAADTKAIGAPIFEGTLTWARDAHGEPVKVAQLEEEARALTLDQKAQILLHKGVIDDQQNKAWRSNPLDFYEKLIDKKFNETQLKAGVVWKDAELRSLFKLTDHQIGLYREFRASLDKSLSNLTISEMVKMGGKDAQGMLEDAMATEDVTLAGELLRDHFIELAKATPTQMTMHLDTAKQIMDLGDKGIDLMKRGYAPLSRFGKYTVYVQENDEQVYFGMFESQAEASRMARQMQADHPQAEVSHGTVSAEAYKLFAGVAPETIELFGSMVGLDSQADTASTEVYQAYLKLAKNNRSAMKRLIQRKGIAGFSEDAGRVLAGFVYSNARLTAGNVNLGKIDEAVTAIPKQEGELTDAAMQLRDFIRNPEGGGNKLGGLMFAQFLGGSVASAMVNLTQPVAMTLPYLSQFGGITKAGAEIVAAVRDAGKASTGDANLDAAMQWAADEGIVAPQEIHYLHAQAAGKAALRSGDGTRAGDTRALLNNTKSKVMVGWGKLFAMAELVNRRVTFIAAYRTAVREGMVDPARFAQETVTQTQGMYNSGNKPKWARGAIGGLAMTFKQYSIAYVELLSRMATAGAPGSKERAAGRRGALYMVAVLFLLAGADGLPFEQDLEDALDGIMQRLGYNFSSKRKKQEFLTEVLGAGGADFVTKGLSSMPGMPIDVAGRFGMGNLIPATGLLTKKDSYTRDIAELAGPAGDFAKRAFTATGRALGGDVAGAALEISPVAVRNVAKAVDMSVSGNYRDARGYNINPTSPLEAFMKGVGFQPNSTANIQDAKGQALNMLSQTRMRSAEIQERWAQGIYTGNQEWVAAARQARDDWNQKNPEAPIRVNMPALQKRVRAMRQDALMRTQMTAPKALKQTVKSQLSEVRGE